MTNNTIFENWESSEIRKEQMPGETNSAESVHSYDRARFQTTAPSQTSPDTSQADQTSSEEIAGAAETEADSNGGTLDLHILDGRGDPIRDFTFRVIDIGPINRTLNAPPSRRQIFVGKTDSDGRAPPITGLELGTRFEIQVKKDNGEYKLAAIGTMSARESVACLKSPKVRFEFSTYSHRGSPGSAEKVKQSIIKNHNQTLESTPNISRNPDSKPTVRDNRDENGNPKLIIKDGLPNMYGQHAFRTPIIQGGKTDIEKVERLIEFGMEQASWAHTNMPSAAIIEKMKRGTYQIAETKDISKPTKWCARYVKIALWKSGFSHNNGDINSSVQLARDLGPALETAGFQNITKLIPDARWAAPGDVIVYIRTLKPDAAGHIDIRTYDGYLSDFLGTTLPVRTFTVIGIYRKYIDPLPEKRVRAFLKVLREWECHEEYDDSKRYFILQQALDGNRRFTDTSKHPFLGREIKNNTFAGAYQISLPTWKEASDRYAIPSSFTPLIQDRIAVSRFEFRKALTFIRTGKIEDAVKALVNEWTSLPGGKHARKGRGGNRTYIWTMGDLLEVFNRNLSEL